jgi:hypothetical protein
MDDLRGLPSRPGSTALFGDWSAAEQAELGRVLGHLNEVLERNACSQGRQS